MKRVAMRHRFQLSWRYLFEKKSRVILTLLGVMVGTATIFAIAVANETTLRSFSQMMDDVTGRADLEVTAVADEGLPFQLMDQLGSLSEVSKVIPMVSRQAVLLSGEERNQILVLGIDPAKDASVRRYSLAQGRLIQDGSEITLVADTAASKGIALGQETALLTAAGPVKLMVVGLLKKEGPAAYQNGTVAFVPLSVAQNMFTMGDRVSTIQIVLREGTSSEAGMAAIRRIIPTSALVQFPASRGKSAGDWMTGTTTGLTYASYLSIFLGSFIIFNTFSMTVAERRREISILRALGAPKRQVLSLILVEALLVGILGTLLGLLFGLLLAQFFIVLMAQYSGAVVSDFRIPLDGVLYSLIAGIVGSLVSSFLPARQATEISPLEGMRPVISHGEKIGRFWVIVGLPCLGAGLLLAAPQISGNLPAWASLTGGLLVMMGSVMVLPAIYDPLVRALGVILRPILGTQALLAERNLRRAKTRNALTAGVVMAALSFSMALGSSVQSSMDATTRWLNSTVAADFFLRGTVTDPGAIVTVQLNENLENDLKKIPQVAIVDKLRFLRASGLDGDIVVMAKSFQSPTKLGLTLEKGEEEAVRAGLRRGEIVASTTLAQTHDLEIGSQLVLPSKTGAKLFRVAGINTEFTNGGNAVYMDWQTAQKELGLGGVDVFMIEATPKADLVALEAELSRFAKGQGLMLQSARDLHQYISKIIDSMFGFLWAIGFISLVVASLGTVNTLTANVLDRWREIAMLRAVAATRRQVRRLVLVEALFLGLLAAVLGIPVGIVAALTSLNMTNRLNGYTLTYSWNWGFWLGVAMLAIAATLLSSTLPARRATKVNIVAAIKHE